MLRIDARGFVDERRETTLEPLRVQSLPEEVALETGYPNPFNASTTIGFHLPDRRHVRLEIYNVAGQLIRVLIDEERTPGRHTVRWEGRGADGSIAPSGVYFSRLIAGDRQLVRRMTLVK